MPGVFQRSSARCRSDPSPWLLPAPPPPGAGQTSLKHTETHRNIFNTCSLINQSCCKLKILFSFLLLRWKSRTTSVCFKLQIMFSKCLINTMFMVIVALKCCWCYHETKILSQGVRGIVRDEGKAEEGKKREEESHEKHMT